MLDFGFSELLLIMAIAVFVVGPQEIPKIMLTLGRITRRISYIKYAFSQQFDEFLREAELQDLRKQVNFEAPSREPDEEFDEAASDAHVIDLDLEPDAEREEEALPALPPKKESVSS
jgi:sec-independent protein translocase protein TatB